MYDMKLILPKLILLGDIKTYNFFKKSIEMKNSFQFLFIRQNIRKKQIYQGLLLILLRKTQECWGITYDVIDALQCLSL